VVKPPNNPTTAKHRISMDSWKFQINPMMNEPNALITRVCVNMDEFAETELFVNTLRKTAPKPPPRKINTVFNQFIIQR